MAFSMNGGYGGGRGGRNRFHGNPAMAEINIVPLVDVVLVLLIIFMLTAHVMEYGLEIEVPKVKQQKESAQELPVINISRSGDMMLNEVPVNINELGDVVHKRFPGQKAAYVRADKLTPWDPIAQVVAELGSAKIEVRMVTQPADDAPSRR